MQALANVPACTRKLHTHTCVRSLHAPEKCARASVLVCEIVSNRMRKHQCQRARLWPDAALCAKAAILRSGAAQALGSIAQTGVPQPSHLKVQRLSLS
eukprot:1407941-Pleurochrysis_carterae.AAC.1